MSGQQEAIDLTVVLKAGSLPASVEYLEERTVGASLGADSIRQGVRSSLLGLALVVVAMLVYYRKAGINAVLALFLNLLILLAMLSYFGFVLTLPGIAGIVLTIGMAVDANVLIFERIREEAGGRQGRRGRAERGIREGVSHDYRHEPYDHHRGRVPVLVREGAGTRLRRDAGHRPDSEPFHIGVRVPHDF